MRGFIAFGAAIVFFLTALVGNAVAATALPPRCDAHFYGLGNGEGVSVFCRQGPSDKFRVVAYCEAGLSSWNEYGTFGYTAFDESDAQCRGLIGSPHVAGHRIDWL